jgi:phage baseplate assembly protein W
MAVSISRAFRDISLSFTRHPVTNDITILRNEDAIKKSVINLARTRLTERFFNDLLGTSIEDSMFELNNSDISSFLEEEITTLLNNFEPRITLTNVYIDSQPDSNDLYIRIEYDITGLPFPTQNIEFILQPTRV